MGKPDIASLAVEYLQGRIQSAKLEIGKIEKKIYDAEAEYFSSESSQMGTLLKVCATSSRGGDVGLCLCENFLRGKDTDAPRIFLLSFSLSLSLYLSPAFLGCCFINQQGYEGFLSSKDNLRKRARTFKIEDRLFSLSSRTSPAAKEEERALDEHQNSKRDRDEGGLSRSRSSSKLVKRARSNREFKRSSTNDGIGRY
uniref:Chromatin modification-related protein MEAF6 n=1 Tax=Chloropicon primus TaxID=1764295 RepID=A0A7S2SZM4_9CHLO|mmetsp:Transcript_14004/g.39584  ORF Transcript_14004/g.39584 Transcript_14004/m.39584 type:complete len:198 (+) Transcript_14004:100-693(+)